MADWIMIGVPSSAGAHYAGQDRAPDALRAAGLAQRLADVGESVQDAGNLLAALDGAAPLLDPARLAIVGADPRETDDAGRAYLADRGVSLQEAPAFAADPAAAARRAIETVASASGPVFVHFDVDVVDSGDLPLGNFPHYGSGPRLEHVVACLRVLRAHPSFAGIVLTEVNPTHDGDGSQLGRYVDAVVQSLAG